MKSIITSVAFLLSIIFVLPSNASHSDQDDLNRYLEGRTITYMVNYLFWDAIETEKIPYEVINCYGIAKWSGNGNKPFGTCLFSMAHKSTALINNTWVYYLREDGTEDFVGLGKRNLKHLLKP